MTLFSQQGHVAKIADDNLASCTVVRNQVFADCLVLTCWMLWDAENELMCDAGINVMFQSLLYQPLVHISSRWLSVEMESEFPSAVSYFHFALTNISSIYFIPI